MAWGTILSKVTSKAARVRVAKRLLAFTGVRGILRWLKGSDYEFIDAYSDMSGEIQFREELTLAIAELLEESISGEASSVPVDTEYLRDTIAWFEVRASSNSLRAHMGALAYYAKYTPNYLQGAISDIDSAIASASFDVVYTVITEYAHTYDDANGDPTTTFLEDVAESTLRYQLSDFVTASYEDRGVNQIIVLNASVPSYGSRPIPPAGERRISFPNVRVRAKLGKGFNFGGDLRVRRRYNKNYLGSNVFTVTPREARSSKWTNSPPSGRRAAEESVVTG